MVEAINIKNAQHITALGIKYKFCLIYRTATIKLIANILIKIAVQESENIRII